MKGLLKWLLPILIVAIAGAGAFAILRSKPEVETRKPTVPAPLIRAMTVTKEDVRLTVVSQGTVMPRTETQVVPEVSGRVIRVSPIFVTGGHFEEGDVLLEIDPFDYRQAVVRSRSQVAQARLRLAQEEAEARLAREEWADLGEGDPSPLTVREPQVAEARAALEAAAAALEQAERDLARTEIRAPYAGRVRDKRVDVGQYVNRGTPVGTIYAVDYVEVRLPLPDAELAFVDVPFRLRGETGREVQPEVILRADFAGRPHEWRGRIVRTEGEIDPRSRMVHVIARVEDPYGRRRGGGEAPLAVGMFVEAEIVGHHVRDVAVLPREALRGRDHLLVVDPDNRLRFRTVDVLRATREAVIVRGGLEAGERVCLSPLEAVTDGMKVRVAGDGADEAPESPGAREANA